MQRILTIAALPLLLLAGCEFQQDDKAEFDTEVDLEWIGGRELVSAVEYFESGGHFEDVEVSYTARVDEQIILPLARRVRDEMDIDIQVILDEEQQAFALICPVPPGEGAQQHLRKILQAADDDFDGVIMRNWGHRWISLDFFDPQEVKILEQSEVLEAIIENNDK